MVTCGLSMVVIGLIFAFGCLMAVPWFHLAVPISFLGLGLAIAGLVFLLLREWRKAAPAKVSL